MPLVTYSETRPWAKAIRNAVLSRKMPPWFADPMYGHFANDRSLSKAEIDTLVQWADAGAPAGDPKDAPPPRKLARRLEYRISRRRLRNAESVFTFQRPVRSNIST